MDKKLFLLAGAALALTACSNEEPVAINNGNAIGFRTAVSSRAQETNQANLTEFSVSALYNNDGTEYFTDVEFARDDENDDTYQSVNKYYWPGSAKLNFVAYSALAKGEDGTWSNSLQNTTLTHSVENTTDGVKFTLEEFTPEEDANDQTDLIVASTVGSKQSENGTPLDFQHMLSQIEVRAKNGNANYKFTVKGVRIGGLVNAANLSYTKTKSGETTTSAAAWEATRNTAEGGNITKYTLNFEEGSEIVLGENAVLLTGDTSVASSEEGATTSTEDTNNFMIIPQELAAWKYDETNHTYDNGTYIALLVKIEMMKGDEVGSQIYPIPAEEGAEESANYAWAAIAIDGEWQWNKKYVYTLDFSTGAGRVGPEETPNDIFKPGDKIFGSEIMFTVNEFIWQSPADDENFNGNIDMSEPETETETPEVTE